MPLGALCMCAVEWLLLVLLRYSHFANLWEIQWGTLWLAPTVILGASVAGLAGAALVTLGTARSAQLRLVAQLVVALLAGWLGFELTQGRHFEVWWRRTGFILVLMLAACFVQHFAGRRLEQWLQRWPRRTLVVAFSGALVLLFLNRFVLVRLYPAFHWGLACGSLLLSGVGVLAGTKHTGLGSLAIVRRLRLIAPVVLLGLLFAAKGGAGALSRLDNFRWVVTENAPTLGFAISAAAYLAEPSAPSNASDQTGPSVEARANLNLQGRDVLLVTVDALRADHVGAYGYSRPTTPHLDALAGEGVRFDRAYCATPHTSYSVTSLLTGKYMRPLLLQDLGADSETWADLLRKYGYHTAAFYPPAIFFIDTAKFAAFDDRQLGFEYQKREFLEGPARVEQVRHYLEGVYGAPDGDRAKTFVWVHLFGPHEPYESHAEHPFGDADLDRYDSEIRATDDTIGALVQTFRAYRPEGIVVVTADHGEEFGDHGGRYHGTSVYEEQVRVPLVVSASGLLPKVITKPVQTIDLLPTVLSALEIPIRPRIRGRDLTTTLAAADAVSNEPGFAFAETDEQAMLAEGTYRLVCLRRVGACQLFDLKTDPTQTQDVSRRHPDVSERLRDQLRKLNAGHGQFETAGARAEGLRWPGPILRAIAGDVDAALDVASLLDDADVQVRRKAASVLFDLGVKESAPPLRLALQRDEDDEVRAYSALALSRLGEGAALTRELLRSPDQFWRRRAALALVEAGEAKGTDELIAWWAESEARDFETSKRLLSAFARLKPKDAVWMLAQSLSDVRLRPFVITTLAEIGDETAVNSLLTQFKREPYQHNRVLLAQALLKLGANDELAVPLRKWLGVGEPLEGGLRLAMQAQVLDYVGGPSKKDLKRLAVNSDLGQLLQVVVPKTGNGRGIRALVRATNHTPESRQIRIGISDGAFSYDASGKLQTSRRIPEIAADKQLVLTLPARTETQEIHALVPESLGLEPGRSSYVVVYAEHGVSVEAVAFVPLQDENLEE
jgi:arylsulfatase A-like enzyme/HEAT repeat protein